MNRPIGVTMLAVLQLMSGFFATWVGLYILFFRSAISQTVSEGENVSQVNIFIIAFGGFLLVVGLIGLLLAYGLFKLKGWAWLTALILNGLKFLSSLSAILSNQNRTSGVIIALFLTGGIIYCLLQPEVKRAFGKN